MRSSDIDGKNARFVIYYSRYPVSYIPLHLSTEMAIKERGVSEGDMRFLC